jgi:hypothetical protein
MKERPILFSGAMVCALLNGTKTQTRRIVKPRGDVTVADLVACGRCPYGQPGDRLWVKETWRTDKRLDDKAPSKFSGWPVRYISDDKVLMHGAFYGATNGKTRVSIHMPRWASRITLEITGVRVERLKDISEADAKAEGVSASALVEMKDGSPCYSAEYRDLWERINGIGSWEKNPWVWVIEFKQVKP